jgi:uncharacterized protein YeaO (DUF488 family)
VVKIKKVYEPVSEQDGKRILVDRIWPRGLKKEEARLDEWLREIAPSTPLRKWFGHDPGKWPAFRKKYKEELKSHADLIKRLRSEAKKKTVTLLFSARNEDQNQAVVLKEVLDRERAHTP